MRTMYLWLLQLFTGILIFVLVGVQLISIHLRAIMRFFGVAAPESSPVVNQADPGIWAGFLVFLAAIILFHALIGLRQTALELGISVEKARIITWAIIVGGIFLLLSTTILLFR